MIISIRGTSGSGKTHIVREVIKLYKTAEPVYRQGRKRPVYVKYWRGDKIGPADLAILGHYETACGGCDTLSGIPEACELAASLSNHVKHVIMEGLLLSPNYHGSMDLIECVGRDNYVAVILTTPIDVCVAGINSRRWAKDPDKAPVDPHNTEVMVGRVEKVARQFREQGVTVIETDRPGALKGVISLLKR